MTSTLRRAVGLPGAVLLGLGSMVGTGVFVSLGIAADVAGPSVVPAVLAAAVLATANGLSSAQLAAAHPVSGGTYEYGYRRLSPAAGFSAGWLFLLAKSASAATASLGLAGYVLDVLPGGSGLPPAPVAAALALMVTAVVAGGIRRSNRGNAVLVGLALLGLVGLVVAALPTAQLRGTAPFSGMIPRDPASLRGFLEGSALMFVAFTGYGRLATLGEEVRDPARVIPRAIGVTMVVVTALYAAVAATGVAVLGAEGFARATAETAAPLEAVARAVETPGLPILIAGAATAALAGVLLNLILGLSRVLLAMGRRGDAPDGLARIDARTGSPTAAVWACGVLVAGLALIGDVRVTWSFSAFTVLIYYALTNLAALRLGPDERRYPRAVAVAGLVGCLGLGVQIDPAVAAAGVGLLAAGLLGRAALRAV